MIGSVSYCYRMKQKQPNTLDKLNCGKQNKKNTAMLYILCNTFKKKTEERLSLECPCTIKHTQYLFTLWWKC